MRIIILLGLVALLAAAVSANRNNIQCKIPPAPIPKDWATMVEGCTKKIKEQIKAEINAAMTYMAMGAHFSRDTINRPGFAKLFFEAATEERQHAIKLIEYLLMRGNLMKGLKPLIKEAPKPQNTTWNDGFEALNEALRLETTVTGMINDIIKECEASMKNGVAINDYHVVDWLTQDFLTEQYRGQRDIAGMSSTLGKMIKNHGALGEFLFDKKLLNGELLK